MGKLTNLNNLDKLSKALDARYKELVNEEQARALAEEQSIRAELDIIEGMFGGKSIKYVTQAEYDTLSEEEKNSETVTYFIIDAEDLSHEHENKEFLDNLAARNIAIGNKSQLFNGADDLVYSIEDIGAAPAEHSHDNKYYTETEIDGKIEDINDSISNAIVELTNDIGLAKSGAISESKSYTDTAISKLVDSAPEAMNTLNELANAINEHQNEYEAYVSTVSTAIANAKAEAIADATTKVNNLGASLTSKINADVKAEMERAVNAETNLQAAIDTKANASHGNHVPATQTANNAVFLRNDNTWAAVTPANIGAAPSSHGNHVPATQTANNAVFLRNDNTWAAVTPANIGAAPSSHTHDDIYYTETEIDGKIEDINNSIGEVEAGVQANTEIIGTKADKSYVDEKLEVVDALKLNGYSLWVGTTEELEAIGEKDPNTLYFEIDDGTGEEVVQVDVVNGVLQLTTDKYQKTNMLDGTRIVFPSVSRFTEIHLYFSAGIDMNLEFPDCKWRVEPNIEEGSSYELIATYNTIEWLVNVIVYS